MKCFKYWGVGQATAEEDGHTMDVCCYGGSNESVDDALHRAAELAERAARALRTGERKDAYLYADRPLREEIVEKIQTQGESAAVITRNTYGSLVLNTSRVLFADIDLPPTTRRWRKRGLLGLLGLGKESPPPDEEVLARIYEVSVQEHGLGMRVYRTPNGFRCLVTSGFYEPTSTVTRSFLESLGSDPLYIQLCNVQECFRARLTAKFWRCDAPGPPFRFPWPTGEFETIYRTWERAYHEQADRYAACAFVTTLGSQVMHPEVEQIVAVHDKHACQQGAELA